ncbi:hypothetical protein ARMGADRAFT_1046892 [Armillaria gallica]|uniref:Uncharacterized protein n=1 Tax=Armillaria gallica TaxID=47427 RepID=A0A2H3D5C5_ARMGA|nr:hypothetical protein ARMGADRAFT_1046892 [Armillaria gallica]
MSHEQSIDNVTALAKKCEDLLKSCVKGDVNIEDFGHKLRDLGVTPEVAADYVQQLQQRLQQAGPRRSNTGWAEDEDEDNEDGDHGQERERTPMGLTDEEVQNFRRRREEQRAAAEKQQEDDRLRAVEDAAWASLHAKLQMLKPDGSSTKPSTDPASILANLLGLDATLSQKPASISLTILAQAPHIASLVSSGISDPHIAETFHLRQLYATEKSFDNLIAVLQALPLKEPIARLFWCLIIQDHYVDFTKFYASMDRGYDHNEDAKELFAGYAIIKKDSSSAKQPIVSEADWYRVFDAWGKAELDAYRETVVELFRAVPHEPAITIRFDEDIRSRYVKRPFRMDLKNEVQIPLLSQIFRPEVTQRMAKCPASSSSPNPKRATIPCENWNLGYCSMEPCTNRRHHGTCSECGASHRAKDNSECASLLQARCRVRFGRGAGNNEGGSSGSRP